MAQEIVTPEDLEKFRLRLLDDLKKLIQPTNQEKKWLRSAEVRQMLSISHGTLQNLRIKGLPYQKVGGIIFYRFADIIAILEGAAPGVNGWSALGTSK